MEAIEQFFVDYGGTIVACITSICSAIVALWSMIKCFGINKSVKKSETETAEKIQLTQEGIVKAFETARIPTDWKISVSKQVDKKLEDWAEKFLIMFKEHEDIRTQLAIANAKILKNTAAYNKLSDKEKQEVEELIKALNEIDKTIEV